MKYEGGREEDVWSLCAGNCGFITTDTGHDAQSITTDILVAQNGTGLIRD